MSPGPERSSRKEEGGEVDLAFGQVLAVGLGRCAEALPGEQGAECLPCLKWIVLGDPLELVRSRRRGVRRYFA